jgi:hypothetical protein
MLFFYGENGFNLMNRKGFFLLSFLILSIVGSAQSLYKDFYFNMPIEEAKQLLKDNSKSLKKLSFGAGTSYAFRKSSLVDNEKKLVSINIWSNKNLNLTEAKKYLKNSRAYFEANSYKMVYAQENWFDPLLIKKNLPCIRFVDPKETLVVEMYPRGQGSVYNIFITFYNYDWFLRKARGEE